MLNQEFDNIYMAISNGIVKRSDVMLITFIYCFQTSCIVPSKFTKLLYNKINFAISCSLSKQTLPQKP